MMRHYFLVISVVASSAGCIGRTASDPEPVTALEQEIDAGLGGLDYRLRSLELSDSVDTSVAATLHELRVHRDELWVALNRLIAADKADSDSISVGLRRQLEDLSVRYQTARLGRVETRARFEEAVEMRFEDLDRELAFLEGDIMRANMTDESGAEIARLYRLRNDVALRIAETAEASDQDFPRWKEEVGAAIARLDIMIGHTTSEIERAYQAKHPFESLNGLWL